MSCLLLVQEYMCEEPELLLIRPVPMPLHFFGRVTIAEHLFQGACRTFSKEFLHRTVENASVYISSVGRSPIPEPNCYSKVYNYLDTVGRG